MKRHCLMLWRGGLLRWLLSRVRIPSGMWRGLSRLSLLGLHLQFDSLISKIGKSKCSLCPSKFANSFRIIGFVILILAMILIVIWFNIRKTKESEFSILFKILTNYTQTASAAMNFNIEFPKALTQGFSAG